MYRSRKLFLEIKLQYLWHNLLLAGMLSACYTQIPKYEVDDQLGSKHTIGRIMENQIISIPIRSDEYQKAKFMIASSIIEKCSKKGITDLRNLKQFRLCMELAGMKCNENNFCNYHGYKRINLSTKKSFRAPYPDRRYEYFEYNADIDISKGWKSFNINTIRE